MDEVAQMGFRPGQGPTSSRFMDVVEQISRVDDMFHKALWASLGGQVGCSKLLSIVVS
jgi:hypothetical protein